MAGTSGVGYQACYHLRGLPLDWTETDLLDALESFGVFGIGLVQMLTKTININPGQKLIVTSGEAIILFRESCGRGLLEVLPMGNTASSGPIQVQVKTLDLPDKSKDPQLALLCNPTRKAMMGDNFQRELFYDWFSRTIKAREVILRSNYELYASCNQGGTCERNEADSPISKGSIIKRLMLTRGDSMDSDRAKNDALSTNAPKVDGKTPPKIVTQVPKRKPIIPQSSTVLSHASSPSVDPMLTSGPPTPITSAPPVPVTFAPSAPATSAAKTNLSTTYEKRSIFEENQADCDDKQTPISTSVTNRRPAVLSIEGILPEMDPAAVERFFKDKLNVNLDFFARYKTTVEATNDGRPSLKFDMLQDDGAIIINNATYEQKCLEMETSDYLFTTALGKNIPTRLKVSKMTSGSKILQVLEAYELVETIRNKSIHSGNLTFDKEYMTVTVNSHQRLLIEKSSIETKQQEGYNVSALYMDVLEYSKQWLHMRESPKPAPLYVSGVYFKWNDFMLARYIESKLKRKLKLCALYTKQVKSDAGNGVELTIPQGDAVIVFQSMEAQERCLSEKRLYPKHLPLLSNGQRRYLEVTKIADPKLIQTVLIAADLQKSAEIGMNGYQYLKLAKMYQEMITIHHRTLLSNQRQFNDLREQQGIVCRVIERSILELHTSWWRKRRYINEMSLEGYFKRMQTTIPNIQI